MDIWRQRFPERFLDVRYEEVAADVETESRRIINYLQLPWEDACANFHQQKTAVTTAKRGASETAGTQRIYWALAALRKTIAASMGHPC